VPPGAGYGRSCSPRINRACGRACMPPTVSWTRRSLPSKLRPRGTGLPTHRRAPLLLFGCTRSRLRNAPYQATEWPSFLCPRCQLRRIPTATPYRSQLTDSVSLGGFAVGAVLHPDNTPAVNTTAITYLIILQPNACVHARGVCRVAVQRLVYAQHGRELMGLKSPVCEPLYAMERRESTR